jgi:hypothetical protein
MSTPRICFITVSALVLCGLCYGSIRSYTVVGSRAVAEPAGGDAAVHSSTVEFAGDGNVVDSSLDEIDLKKQQEQGNGDGMDDARQKIKQIETDRSDPIVDEKTSLITITDDAESETSNFKNIIQIFIALIAFILFLTMTVLVVLHFVPI